MIKKFSKSICGIVLLTSLVTGSALAQPSVESNPIINPQKVITLDLNVAKKIAEIDSKYEVGQPFSQEDSDFIKTHAHPIQQNKSISGSVAPASSVQIDNWYFRGVKWNNYAAGELKGYATVNLGQFNHKVNTNFATDEIYDNYHPKLTNEFQLVAYGLIGSDGVIGKIVDFTLKNECTNASYCHQSKGQEFSGVPAYYNIFPKGIISYSGGGGGELDILPGEFTKY